MQLRRWPRALALAVAGVMVFAGVATANGVRTDADPDQVENQPSTTSARWPPVKEISAESRLAWLFCTNGSHLDPGQSVVLTVVDLAGTDDGAVVDVTTGSTAAAPAGWALTASSARRRPRSRSSGARRHGHPPGAPTAPGSGYLFQIFWSRAVTPVGNGDGGATSGTTAATFELEVVANTPRPC